MYVVEKLTYQNNSCYNSFIFSSNKIKLQNITEQNELRNILVPSKSHRKNWKIDQCGQKSEEEKKVCCPPLLLRQRVEMVEAEDAALDEAAAEAVEAEARQPLLCPLLNLANVLPHGAVSALQSEFGGYF